MPRRSTQPQHSPLDVPRLRRKLAYAPLPALPPVAVLCEEHGLVLTVDPMPAGYAQRVAYGWDPEPADLSSDVDGCE